MKLEDIVNQLANRINQPHVIESYLRKIEKGAYLKGAESQQEELKELKEEIRKKEFFKIKFTDVVITALEKDIKELKIELENK